jgi:hypothetical protein
MRMIKNNLGININTSVMIIKLYVLFRLSVNLHVCDGVTCNDVVIFDLGLII